MAHACTILAISTQVWGGVRPELVYLQPQARWGFGGSRQSQMDSTTIDHPWASRRRNHQHHPHQHSCHHHHHHHHHHHPRRRRRHDHRAKIYYLQLLRFEALASRIPCYLGPKSCSPSYQKLRYSAAVL